MAQCQSSFFRKNKKGQHKLVPCGKCPICKARRVSAWSFRLLQEEKKSINAKFITLTYDDKNLRVTRNGYRTLCRRDLQLFFKRLRQIQKRQVGLYQRATIKYFAVGEYGGKIGRPHYHIILFNADTKLIQKAWSETRGNIHATRCKSCGGRSGSKIYGTKSQVGKNFLGFVHYGDSRGVTGASVGYCLKYILTPKDISAAPPDYDGGTEFAVMSQGLGKCYLTPQMIRWHKADLKNRMYINIGDGKKASMPRYFKEKIYDEFEREEISAHSETRLAEECLRDLYKIYQADPENGYRKHKRSKQETKTAAYRKQRLLIKKRIAYV